MLQTIILGLDPVQGGAAHGTSPSLPLSLRGVGYTPPSRQLELLPLTAHLSTYARAAPRGLLDYISPRLSPSLQRASAELSIDASLPPFRFARSLLRCRILATREL